VARRRGPVFEFAFENGVVRCDSHHGTTEGRFADGTLRSYGAGSFRDDRKILDTLEAMAEGREPLCGIEAAMSHTLVVSGAQESGEPVVTLPRELIRETEVDGEHWLSVDGLDDLLTSVYDSARLPTTADAPWVRPARRITLGGQRQVGRQDRQGETSCSPS